MTPEPAHLDACAALVARGDPDRWLSLMAAPVAVRARLLPLYAFNLEVARAPWISTEPMIGQMRLTWWREVLEEIAEGREVRRHEVATPLAAVLPPDAAVALDALVVARHADLDGTPFADAAALTIYLAETGGRLMTAAGAVLGAGPAGLMAAGEAGALAAWLQAVPELKSRGRWPLPDEAPAAVTALARSGLARLAEARAEGPDRAAAPALRAVWRAKGILSRAARDPEQVFSDGLIPPRAGRAPSLLWRQLLGTW